MRRTPTMSGMLYLQGKYFKRFLVLAVISFSVTVSKSRVLTGSQVYAYLTKSSSGLLLDSRLQYVPTTASKQLAFSDLKAALSQTGMPNLAEILRLKGFKFQEPAGQVGPDTPYGQILREIAGRPEIQVVLETGTWDGTGSALALGQGLLKSNGVLFTIEAVEEQWIHAQHNLASYPVRCLLGVGVDTANYPTIKEVEAVSGMDQMHADWRNWHASEKALTDLYPVGLIKPICERYPVQFVHIDGAEFAGGAEYNVMRKHCKDVKFIAMDDVRTFKNFINYGKLKADAGWRVFKENMSERNGWAVFVRLD